MYNVQWIKNSFSLLWNDQVLHPFLYQHQFTIIRPIFNPINYLIFYILEHGIKCFDSLGWILITGFKIVSFTHPTILFDQIKHFPFLAPKLSFIKYAHYYKLHHLSISSNHECFKASVVLIRWSAFFVNNYFMRSIHYSLTSKF